MVVVYTFSVVVVVVVVVVVGVEVGEVVVVVEVGRREVEVGGEDANQDEVAIQSSWCYIESSCWS